jgi:hypothetical protein
VTRDLANVSRDLVVALARGARKLGDEGAVAAQSAVLWEFYGDWQGTPAEHAAMLRN